MTDTFNEPVSRRHSSLIPAVVVCGLAIVCFIGIGKFVAWQIQNRPAAEVFFEKVASNLDHGDPVADVQRELGESKLLTWDDVPGWVTAIQQRKQFYPDGMETTDKFLHYSVADANGNNEEWYLQFRDGKLINFQPTDLPATYAEGRAGIAGLSQ